MKNSKLLIVLLSVLLVSLSGCGIDKTKVKNGVGEPDITIYKIKGKPLECLRAGHQLSCNWDKYNK